MLMYLIFTAVKLYKKLHLYIRVGILSLYWKNQRANDLM